MQLDKLTLEFKGEEAVLEEPFLESYFDKFHRHIQSCHIYSMVAWVGWFGLGATSHQGMNQLFLIQTFGIIWPSFLFGLYLSTRSSYIKIYPFAQAVFIILTGVCSLYVVMKSPLAYFNINTMAFTLSFIFGYMIIRARFIVALGASAFISILYIGAVLPYSAIPWVHRVSGCLYIIILNVLGAITAYGAEKAARRDFFTSIALMKQREELDIANRELMVANLKFEELSLLDSLTELHNRRCFDEILRQQWAIMQRSGAPLSVIMLDVDFFKAYNDSYGHQAGDRCLQAIGEVLKKTLRRATDMAFRYGGEEFVILLPDTGTDGAEIVAQKVQEYMHALQLPHDKSKVCHHVTISMGIATTESGLDNAPEYLMKEADNALYIAKERGRDRYVLSDGLGRGQARMYY